ncbi:MAG: GNAT family N-acetyltransferase [Cobetia marina]
MSGADGETGAVRKLVLDDATLAALQAIESTQAHGLSRCQLADVLSDASRCILGWHAPATPERLAGFVVLARGPFEAEIEAITVHADLRGQGIGRALLQAAIERARQWHHATGLERLLLEVRAGNDAVRALYAHAGFHVDGVRRGYYPALPPAPSGTREDALLMSLPLE